MTSTLPTRAAPAAALEVDTPALEADPDTLVLPQAGEVLYRLR